MQAHAGVLVTSVMLVAVLILVAGCTNESQQQSDLQQATVANAAEASNPKPTLPPEVPVPAYGPNPHPNYYYPPVGVSAPGPSSH